jgi:hypothetical protein
MQLFERDGGDHHKDRAQAMTWFRTLFSKVRKANISPSLKVVFEQAGTATVQTLVFSGWVNREGLPEELRASAIH